MFSRSRWSLCHVVALLIALPTVALAQKAPYDVFPPAKPPYYRVRFEASTRPGELIFPVSYTIWIPENVKLLRGVIVHQHGCGEGFCKSGLTGAYDLHWQALAKKHDCALLAPSYEQPEKADCQMWCDPRNGSVPPFRSVWLSWARSADMTNWRKCPGRCGDTAAAGIGRGACCCSIQNVSPPPGWLGRSAA